jgi:hypothetical protein
MTELMKRYEADFEKGLTHECYQSWLEAEISDNKRHIATLESKIGMYEYEIKQLKAQLTWRPVSECPSKEGWVLCRRKSKCICGCGRVGIIPYARHWLIAYQTWEEFVKRCNIVEWLPIPPAPEVK